MKLKKCNAWDCNKNHDIQSKKRQLKNKKTIQCNNLNTAGAVIAFSGRCCLFPFHRGPDPLQPLQRKMRGEKTQHI